MNNASSQLTSADTDWTALQYLVDGLTESAAAEFEATLQYDQSAREALARAVEITQAVAVIESSTDLGAAGRPHNAIGSRHVDVVLAPVSDTWLTPVVGLTVAALACITLVVFWQPGRLVPSPGSTPGGQPVSSRDGTEFDSGELASLWVSTSEFLVTADLVERDLFELPADEEFLGPRGELQDGSEAEADADRLEAPSWMMAALALPADSEAQE